MVIQINLVHLTSIAGQLAQFGLLKELSITERTILDF